MHVQHLWLAVLLALPLTAQSPSGDPTLPPKGLTIAFVGLGRVHGDSTIVIGPTGRCLVFDAGNNGSGTGIVVPLLKKLAVKKVDYVVASHYHADHIGGLDEVMQGIPFDGCWDRGNNRAPSNSTYRGYLAAAGSKRRTVKVGQVFDLGAGAKATVVCSDGLVLGDKQYPISTKSGYENSASNVLKVEYGDFSLWLGGDLNGGGANTYDMETPVSRVVGDVEIYQANHHGFDDCSNANLVANLKPDVTVISCGAGNSYGIPRRAMLDRVTQRSASRLVLCTSGGSGNPGFTSAGGTITVTTDGWRYRITDASGGTLDLYTDEVTAPVLSAGDLIVSEFHRDPTITLGAFVEIFNRGRSPANLRGLSVKAQAGAFTLATPYRLLPGQRLLFVPHGDPAKNGGLGLAHAWPNTALALGKQKDDLRLALGATIIDRIAYGSGFAGGSGVTAERVDLEKAATAANFRAATTSWRNGGDKGTPLTKNSVDATTFPLHTGVELVVASAPGSRALHLFASAASDPNRINVIALSIGTTPGLKIGNVTIPLNFDAIFAMSISLPGFIGVVPLSGLRGVRLPLPAATANARLYAAHFLLSPGPHLVTATSTSLGFLLP